MRVVNCHLKPVLRKTYFPKKIGFKMFKKYEKSIKHFNPKKKLVLSGVSALFTCCGAPPTSFFLGLTMFINSDLNRADPIALC